MSEKMIVVTVGRLAISAWKSLSEAEAMARLTNPKARTTTRSVVYVDIGGMPFVKAFDTVVDAICKNTRALLVVNGANGRLKRFLRGAVQNPHHLEMKLVKGDNVILIKDDLE